MYSERYLCITLEGVSLDFELYRMNTLPKQMKTRKFNLTLQKFVGTT